MTDATTPEPRRARRPARSRRPLPLLRRRTRKARQRPPSAAATAVHALNELVEFGDVFEVRRQKYLVTPVDDALIEEIAAALGEAEDDEENGDMESNTGDDEPSIGGYEDLELDEAERGEPELGWQNAYHGGSQLGIADECRDGPCYESDGDCDDEDGDPGGGNVEDEGEEDHADDEPPRVVPTGWWERAV